MDKGKNNNKWLLKFLMIGMVIISFICLSVLTWKTRGLADITLNPYCTGDTGRIEELTENFIVEYGEENLRIDWSESTGIPERIHIYSTESFVLRYPEIPYSWEMSPTMVEIWAGTYRSKYIEEAKEFALSFLLENSVFLGINVNELEFSKTDVGSKNTYAKVIYNQVYI
ncbi:MAG: hypothetical protein ACMUIU_16920 [bacterium]